MQTVKIDDLLQRTSLFEGLEREDIHKIFARGMTTRVAKGETVFLKGTIGSQMYLVLVGKLGVFDNQKLLAELKMGDMFGEMALVTSEPRSATVAALEDSQVFVLTETFFQKLMTKRVAIQMLMNIVKTLSHRLKESNLRISG